MVSLDFNSVSVGDLIKIVGGRHLGVQGAVIKLFVRSDGRTKVLFSKLDDPSVRCTVPLEHVHKIKD